MDDDDTRPRDAATEAFDGMSDRLALLTRAVEGLTAERQKTPDYTETLGQIVRHIAGIECAQAALVKSPAMQLTPDTFAIEIIQAAEDVRAQDAETIRYAAKGLARSTETVDRSLESARTARDQKRTVLRTAGTAIAATMFVMLILPGIVYRALPERWLIPERVAARVLRLAPWRAGERLLSTADPEHWRTVLLSDHIVQGNRDAIIACGKAASKAKEPVRCAIKIDDPPW